ncbi:MAG: HAMP domain-containing histidine kinase [Phycisphaerales bacterium]|nr:HAMP domain-containing histidine kinase [Phycisphaerales bacterium]
MASGLSLANKVQLLFGTAVVVLLAAALAVPWFRTEALVYRSQLEVSRQLADAWLEVPNRTSTSGPIPIRVYSVADARSSTEAKPFVLEAVSRMESDSDLQEVFQQIDTGNEVVYDYARALRGDDWRRIEAGVESTTGALGGILLIERPSKLAAGQLLSSRVYLVASWLVASLLAVLLFWFIVNRVVLKPVRRLRDTADKVEQGDYSVRASIETGDDFESLGESFNRMLDEIERTSSQLRSVNETLDFKVTELAEANIGLFESNRLKSEFLANVSHELKTPLNSIIGFAELLDELASKEESPDPKRHRYVSNIIASGRRLLEMISELLEMAKIEAGRVEVTIAPLDVKELLEGLVAIMRPQAEEKRVTIEAKVGQQVPLVETDAGKLQQILFNFLSNAVKFSPEDSTVILAAEQVVRQDKSIGIRFRVSDHGPGIPLDMQESIFEKFRQVDASHTRSHEGTGLGLAICRELAELIGATVSLVSEPGGGSTFSVEVPLTYREKELQPLLGD